MKLKPITKMRKPDYALQVFEEATVRKYEQVTGIDCEVWTQFSTFYFLQESHQVWALELGTSLPTFSTHIGIRDLACVFFIPMALGCARNPKTNIYIWYPMIIYTESCISIFPSHLFEELEMLFVRRFAICLNESLFNDVPMQDSTFTWRQTKMQGNTQGCRGVSTYVFEFDIIFGKHILVFDKPLIYHGSSNSMVKIYCV